MSSCKSKKTTLASFTLVIIESMKVGSGYWHQSDQIDVGLDKNDVGRRYLLDHEES